MRIIHRPKGGVGMKTPFQRYNTTYTDDISDSSDDKSDDKNADNSQDNSPSDTDSVYKARKSARARQAAREASAKKSTENNKDDEKRHTIAGKRLNLISSTAPNGQSTGYSSSDDSSVDSTEVQIVTKQPEIPPQSIPATLVPDLDTLNADAPATSSSGNSSAADLSDCGEFLLPDLDLIFPSDDETEDRQGRSHKKNKITDDPNLLERREKNRQAATECRKRQKEKISELEQEVQKQKAEGETLQQKIEAKRTEYTKMKAFFIKHIGGCEIYKKEQQIRHQQRFLAQKNTAARAKHAEVLRQKAASSCLGSVRAAARAHSHPYKLVQDQTKVYTQLS